MKLIVNVLDYYPTADYTQYLQRGNEIDKPKNATLEVGMLMYDEEHNAVGIILGCIDEEYDGEVRLDSDGMRPIDKLRLATNEDFNLKDVRFKLGLDETIIDLFEHYETLPQEVQDIINSYGDEFGYDGCKEMLDRLEPLGYTFDWGLDGQPIDLKEMSL